MISPTIMASHDWKTESVSELSKEGLQTSVEGCRRCPAKRNRWVERDVQTHAILQDVIVSTLPEYLEFCPRPWT